MNTMIISAVRQGEGWIMIDDEGNYPQEKRVYKTRKEIYQNAVMMYPANSAWQGKKVPGGYRISID